ncbi:MAG: TRAP transporter small permease [Clostridiales bacterium]|nr:TRAP transporter small permease [Clostridiales bacterium]
MKAFEKILDFIADVIKWLVTGILLFMVTVTFIEVIRRYCFGKSFMWADECIRFLIMWVTFLGGAAAFRKNKLVIFDLVTSNVSEKVQDLFRVIAYAIVLVFLAVLIYYSAKALASPSVLRAKGTGFKVSMVWAYLPMPVGFSMMELFCVDTLIKAVKKLMGKGGEVKC